MTLKYRNTATGRVVEILEPHEVVEQAEAAAEERAKVGSKRAKREAEMIFERGLKTSRHVERTIKVMNGDGTRWERVSDSTQTADAAPPKAKTTPKAGAKTSGDKANDE